MPHPKGGYRLNGKRIPSTTTILSRLDDQSNLIDAAVRLALEGKNHKTLWRSAAKVGTAVHSMIELFLNNGSSALSPDMSDQLGLTPEEWEEAKIAFKAFLHWARTKNLQKPDQEVSLISSQYGFGGTFDCLYKTSEGYIVADWKTSKDLRMSTLFQLASYGILAEEHYGPVVGYYAIRVSKTTGEFEHRYYPELGLERQIFIKMVDIYNDIKEASRIRRLK